MRIPHQYPSSRDENILATAITNQGTTCMISAIDAAGFVAVAIRQQDPQAAYGMLTTIAQSNCGFNVKFAAFDNPEDGIILHAKVDFKGIDMCEAGWGLPDDQSGGVPDFFGN